MGELDFAFYTQQMIMWPVRALFGGDIPGIDDVAEASLDYTSNLSSTWYLVSYWLKLVSLLLKEAIHPFLKFDETNIIKLYLWNALLGFWQMVSVGTVENAITYIAMYAILETPWYVILWGYFDQDGLSVHEMYKAQE